MGGQLFTASLLLRLDAFPPPGRLFTSALLRIALLASLPLGLLAACQIVGVDGFIGIALMASLPLGWLAACQIVGVHGFIWIALLASLPLGRLTACQIVGVDGFIGPRGREVEPL